MTDEEAHILQQIKERNEEGIRLLLKLYGSLIKSTVRRYLGSLKSYEEDCINDVLMAVWDNIGSYEPAGGTFSNWLAGICRFKALSCQRKNLRNQKQLMGDDILFGQSALGNKDVYAGPSAEEDFLGEFPEENFSKEMEQMLGSLDETSRRLLLDLYAREVSIEEAARRLKLSKSAAYKRSQRARKKLRKLFS